jgi:hypothetical protein
MKKWIKKSFSVTNMGASNIFKAIFASLLVNISSFFASNINYPLFK